MSARSGLVKDDESLATDAPVSTGWSGRAACSDPPHASDRTAAVNATRDEGLTAARVPRRRRLVRSSAMAREAIPTWFFVLVVARREDRFLLVHERKHGQRWYVPAGRVEPRETLADAALRETLEEAGVPIVLEGVLRVEHTPQLDGSARVRVVLLARPADATPPKSAPDEESLGAAWCSIAELDRLPLRGTEVKELLSAVAAGAPVMPMSMLVAEGTPYPQ